jgi:hypothetical protein
MDDDQHAPDLNDAERGEVTRRTAPSAAVLHEAVGRWVTRSSSAAFRR